MSEKRVALFCGRSVSSAVVANRLKEEFGDIAMIVEGKESRKRFLQRRLKRLGAVTLAGQIAFTLFVPRVLRRLSRRRIGQILAENAMDSDPSILSRAMAVESINSPEVMDWLKRERPDVIVVNGTRIISRRILEATDAIFINTHCGITPTYRGAHGGYWALFNGEPERCGVTVHLVDAGIDTGGILAQRTVGPGPEDNFVTYPYLQVAAALPELVKSVKAALQARPAVGPADGPSLVWYHPTLWQYLYAGLRRSIW